MSVWVIAAAPIEKIELQDKWNIEQEIITI